MKSFVSILKNFRKDELNIFFDNEALNLSAVLDEDRLRKFKILILKNPNNKPDELFFKSIAQNDGLKLSRVLIFLFIYINWLPVKEIDILYKSIISNNILQTRQKSYFEDKQDSHIYSFNKLFSQYINDYMKDIESIYILKNKNVDPHKYAKLIIEEQIGYEGLYFFLVRTNLSFALFDNFNWILVENMEQTGFKYAAEVVSRQLIEEYIFLRNVFKELLDDYKKLLVSMRTADFIFFYEILVWKEKKMKEMYRKFEWFFNENLIKFPSPLVIDEERESEIHKTLLEYHAQKDEIKFMYQNKNSYENFSKKSSEYLKLILTEDDQLDSMQKLYSRNSILDRLGSANLILSQSQL